MTTRHRHPDGARAPQPPRNWTVPAIAACAVLLTVAAGASIAWNDNLGDPMTFTATPSETARPSSRVVRTLPAWPTPAPVLPTDLNAPSYPLGTETTEPPAVALSAPRSVEEPQRDHMEPPAWTPAPSAAAETVEQSTAATQPSDDIAALYELVNRDRATEGCGPVTVHPDLIAQSQAQADTQAADDTMKHSDGVTGFETWGENVAVGPDTAAAVHEAWMGSVEHRANILNCDYAFIGAGFADGASGRYWTEQFAA